jgi:peptide chain release factor 2
MSAADFWNSQEKAQAVVQELKGLNTLLKPLDELIRADDEIRTLVEMGEEDESFIPELRQQLAAVEPKLDDLELKSLLSGPHDSNHAILSINARDGGTDANDWAEMLLRMYINWAQASEYDIELLDRQDDAVAGIQSASIAVRGPFAYGYLKGETGMHRLVRISPFNAEGKRQTSFAAVDVSPEISDNAEIEGSTSTRRVAPFG